MKKGRTLQWILVGLGVVLLSAGCSPPISSQFRQEAVSVDLTAAAHDPGAFEGKTVIWGGKIIKTRTRKTGSEVYVLAMPLDRMEQPVNEQASPGRFIAKSPKYLDPALYHAGVLITVAGRLAGAEAHRVGEIKYRYPIVKAEELHLWTTEKAFIYPDTWYGWGPGEYGPDEDLDAGDDEMGVWGGDDDMGGGDEDMGGDDD